MLLRMTPGALILTVTAISVVTNLLERSWVVVWAVAGAWSLFAVACLTLCLLIRLRHAGASVVLYLWLAACGTLLAAESVVRFALRGPGGILIGVVTWGAAIYCLAPAAGALARQRRGAA